MYALVNGDVFTGSEIVSDRAVLIDQGRIVDLPSIGQLPPELERIDLKGNNVAPGFIDLQVNGGGGALFNADISPESIRAIAAAHRPFGTTAMLATLISTSFQDMLRAIAAVREAKAFEDSGVLGLHLEGPYLNSERAGVHDKAHTRRADIQEIESLMTNSAGEVVLMTLAPEMADEASLSRLGAAGVRLAVGHSNASYAVASAALKGSCCCVTHLFNAMSQLGSREPGVVGAAFDSDKYASVIVDGHHVDYAAVRVAKKVMKDRLFLVTDAMPPVGSDSDQFVLGPYQIVRKNGKLLTNDGVLAGSCLDMASAVRNCIQQVGIPMPEALRMASLYPARVIGCDAEYGYIRKGYLADLVLFNNQIQILGTVKSGQLVMNS